MQDREEHFPAVAQSSFRAAEDSAHGIQRRPWTHSIFFIVLVALLLRLIAVMADIIVPAIGLVLGRQAVEGPEEDARMGDVAIV